MEEWRVFKVELVQSSPCHSLKATSFELGTPYHYTNEHPLLFTDLYHQPAISFFNNNTQLISVSLISSHTKPKKFKHSCGRVGQNGMKIGMKLSIDEHPPPHSIWIKHTSECCLVIGWESGLIWQRNRSRGTGQRAITSQQAFQLWICLGVFLTALHRTI